MRGAQSNEKMNMIGDAAHSLGDRVKRANGSTQIRMKSRTPFRANDRALMFGAKNDVNMETEVR